MRENRKGIRNKIINFREKNNTAVLALSFTKWIIIGSIVGIFTGSACALFLKSLELATEVRMNYNWLIFLLPFGGAFVSFLYSRYGKNSSKGNNLIIETINESSGKVPLRMAPLVFFGTFVTHLFGGSAGREGTGVQIGSSIAEGIGRLFKLDKEDTRIILMAGISSGFASVFGTPLAGTVFGLEVAALGFMSYEALIPCLTASIVGDLVVSVFGVHHTHYKVIGIPELSSIIIIKIVFAAILFGLTSKLFSELTHKLKEVFTERFKNPVIKSMVGGAIVIALVYILGTRDFLGLSIPLISDSFDGNVHPFAFLFKLLFTSLTLGSGFQGGEVTPLFVIGSTLGNSLSNILHISPSFLAALGLIGVFAGATNTPIASFILSIEMFGSQGIIFMFMTCVISYIFSGHTGIYTSQKIGRSKSRLIEVPHNAKLAYFRKNNNDKSKKIEYTIFGKSEFEDSCIRTLSHHEVNLYKAKVGRKVSYLLEGQLMRGKSSIELPTEKGRNKYIMTVDKGAISFNHSSYNPDGHTWSTPPGNRQKQHICIGAGTHVLDVVVEEHYGKKNKIELVNGSLFNNVKILYSVEQVSLSEESLKDVD